MGIRLRRSYWARLPIHFRLGSGAGHTLVWLALALIPIFYGTTWLTTTTVGCQAVPALRGAKSDNRGSCEATRYGPDTNAFGYTAKTQLRYYIPTQPAGNYKINKPWRLHGHVPPTPARKLTASLAPPAPESHLPPASAAPAANAAPAAEHHITQSDMRSHRTK